MVTKVITQKRFWIKLVTKVNNSFYFFNEPEVVCIDNGSIIIHTRGGKVYRFTFFELARNEYGEPLFNSSNKNLVKALQRRYFEFRRRLEESGITEEQEEQILGLILSQNTKNDSTTSTNSD